MGDRCGGGTVESAGLGRPLCLALFGLSLVVAHRLTRMRYDDPIVSARAAVLLFVLLALVTAINIAILAQPMGARHAM